MGEHRVFFYIRIVLIHQIRANLLPIIYSILSSNSGMITFSCNHGSCLSASDIAVIIVITQHYWLIEVPHWHFLWITISHH